MFESRIHLESIKIICLQWLMKLPLRVIVEDVSNHFGISVDSILSDRQQAKIARPRQIAMYLSVNLTPYSHPRIAEYFRRDRTTVIHSIGRIESLINKDAELAQKVKELSDSISPKLGIVTPIQRTVQTVLDKLGKKLLAEATVNPEGLLKKLSGLTD